MAISAVGVFRTGDGGDTWTLCNDGLPRIPVETPHPEVSHCVHKVVLDPAHPETLYMQYHGGVMKSNNGAGSWSHIEEGLPSPQRHPRVFPEP